MKAEDQLLLLKRIEAALEDAQLAAAQLPGGWPLERKLLDALQLSNAWRCDQEGPHALGQGGHDPGTQQEE
jgi:hypothetical protein